MTTRTHLGDRSTLAVMSALVVYGLAIWLVSTS